MEAPERQLVSYHSNRALVWCYQCHQRSWRSSLDRVWDESQACNRQDPKETESGLYQIGAALSKKQQAETVWYQTRVGWGRSPGRSARAVLMSATSLLSALGNVGRYGKSKRFADLSRWECAIYFCFFKRVASKGLPSGYSSMCMCVREVGTYDELSSHDGWRTPSESTALPMFSSHFTHPHQVSAFLAPPLWSCAVQLVLPLRTCPYVRLCYPRIGLVINITYIRIFCDHIDVLHIFDQT